MAIATETVAQRCENIVTGVALNINFPAFEVGDVTVYYGKASLVAVYNVDYTVTLDTVNFNTFTVTPLASLLTKINNLIAADPTETNFIVVRRVMNFLTVTSPGSVRDLNFLSRELDRAAMRFTQLSEEVKRSVRASPRFINQNLVIDDLVQNATLLYKDGKIGVGPTADQVAGAQTSANTATTKATEASNSATAAAGSAQLANDWAQKAENVPVVAGQFSALHHAAKSAASATQAAASAASADFKNFGYGITGNAPLIANLDTAGLASGIYRFDGTTLGSFPAGVVAADTGIVIIDRMDADDERMSLHQGTTQKSFTRRRNAGVLSAWFAVPDFTPVQQNGGVGHGNNKINLGWDDISARLTVDGADQGRLIRNVDAVAGSNGALFAPGAPPLYACRAWVNFNGTGAVAILASGNVSSITDNGVGDYTVNFTTAMPDANYSAVGAVVAGNSDGYLSLSSLLSTAARFVTRTSGAFVDCPAVCFSVVR